MHGGGEAASWRVREKLTVVAEKNASCSLVSLSLSGWEGRARAGGGQESAHY